MIKSIMITIVAVSSVAMASTAFAGLNGFLQSGNPNACVNSGPGNGGEFVRTEGDPGCFTRVGNEAGDSDPVNSNNHAPAVPPGQNKP